MKTTGDTWARQVKNDLELPESFVGFFKLIRNRAEQFPYIVFAPPEKLYHQKTNPKLLVLFDDRVYIAEKIKKQIQVTCFYLQDINYIEHGTMLLHSWITINGCADGKQTTITIEFNTVVESIFKLIIDQIRIVINHLDQSEFAKGQLKKEQDKFNDLMEINFKYMNYGKLSLLAGERLQLSILQPDIRVQFLRFFQRILTYAHLTILTDNELVLIKDVDSYKAAQSVRYGGIRYYITLPKIIRMTIESNLKNELVKLTILLPDEVSISSLFFTTQKLELDLLINSIDKFKIVGC